MFTTDCSKPAVRRDEGGGAPSLVPQDEAYAFKDRAASERNALQRQAFLVHFCIEHSVAIRFRVYRSLCSSKDGGTAPKAVCSEAPRCAGFYHFVANFGAGKGPTWSRYLCRGCLERPLPYTCTCTYTLEYRNRSRVEVYVRKRNATTNGRA